MECTDGNYRRHVTGNKTTFPCFNSYQLECMTPQLQKRCTESCMQQDEDQK